MPEIAIRPRIFKEPNTSGKTTIIISFDLFITMLFLDEDDMFSTDNDIVTTK